jgi:arylsulfatase A-like enzyme
VLVLLALACAAPAPRVLPPVGPGPVDHVVLISIDTLRADHLGAWGGAGTPRLDAFAATGAVFVDATSPAPTTLAAHTSILTGLYPHTHGVPRNGFAIPQQDVLLAERLREAGFTTAGFVGAVPLQASFGVDQGFDHFDDHFDQRKDDPLAFLRGTPELEQSQRDGDAVTDAALRWLDREAPEGRRLFLFAHYFDPHAPYVPPGELGPLPDPSVTGTLDDRRRVRSAWPDPGVQAASDSLAALYAGEVAATDDRVGRLLDGLRARGVLDRALVVLVADHGEAFTEHDEVWDHGLGVWQETVHVPLVVAGPGVSAGRREAPVSTVDVTPTLLDLLGLPAVGLEGESLAPALRGEALSPRVLFSEATKPSSEEAEAGVAWQNARKCRAARQASFKLVRCPLAGTQALFDLRADPRELVDLAASRPEVVAALGAALDAWDAGASPPPASFDADAAVTEQLRALGYLDDTR